VSPIPNPSAIQLPPSLRTIVSGSG